MLNLAVFRAAQVEWTNIRLSVGVDMQYHTIGSCRLSGSQVEVINSQELDVSWSMWACYIKANINRYYFYTRLTMSKTDSGRAIYDKDRTRSTGPERQETQHGSPEGKKAALQNTYHNTPSIAGYKIRFCLLADIV